MQSVCVCACMYVCMYVCIYVCTCMHLWSCRHACTYACLRVCMLVDGYVRMQEGRQVCRCVCMCACMLHASAWYDAAKDIYPLACPYDEHVQSRVAKYRYYAFACCSSIWFCFEGGGGILGYWPAVRTLSTRLMGTLWLRMILEKHAEGSECPNHNQGISLCLACNAQVSMLFKFKLLEHMLRTPHRS